MNTKAKAKDVCEHCNKRFYNLSSKTRHVRRVHKIVVEEKRRKHILCPLCKEDNLMETYKKLNEHLLETHQLRIDVFNLKFSTKEEYDSWFTSEKIEASYSIERKTNSEDSVRIYHHCNRSNLRDYQSRCTLRNRKSEGTIKIRGVCPSRILSRIYKNGEYHIEFYKTHVGHDDKIRTKHLAKTEKAVIINKLKRGVNTGRIINDARQLAHGSKGSRLKLLSKNDLYYLSRKNAIDKTRPKDEVIAKKEAEIQLWIKEHRSEINNKLNNVVTEEMKAELIKKKIQSRVNQLIQPDDNEEIMAYYEVMKKFDERKETEKFKMEIQES